MLMGGRSPLRVLGHPLERLDPERHIVVEVCAFSVDAEMRVRQREVGMKRNPHAGEPFADAESVIRAALEDCSIPALLCSLVHMTGDPAWIRGDIRPRVSMSLDIQCGMSEDEQAEIRRQALPYIAAYRDTWLRTA